MRNFKHTDKVEEQPSEHVYIHYQPYLYVYVFPESIESKMQISWEITLKCSYVYFLKIRTLF